MSMLKKGMYAAQFPVGDGDPHWDKVVSLMHFDGDLTDEKGRIWTLLPGTTIDTVEPIYGTGSLLCNGLEHGCETSNPINNTSADFTIEVTVIFTALPGPTNPLGYASTQLWSQPQSSSRGEFGLTLSASNVLALDLRGGSTAAGLEIPSDPLEVVTGKKYHVAHTYDNGVHRVFLDGTKVIEKIYEVGWKNTNRPFAIGRGLVPTASQYRYGSFAKFDEFRITKGVARYTENFTPPTKPFPNY